MGKNIGMIIAGLLVFVLALIMAGIVVDTAATTGANANIGSFTGVRSVNDLFPLVMYFGGMLVGLGAMGVGAAGMAGYGPSGGGKRKRL